MNTQRLLLVDPDAHFASVFRAYLEEAGWTVEHVSFGRQALASCAALRPDVVVSEIDLEDVHGLDLIAAIRALPNPPPVLFCTHLPGARNWNAQTLERLGAAACFVRPVRLDVLLQAIDKAKGQETITPVTAVTNAVVNSPT